MIKRVGLLAAFLFMLSVAPGLGLVDAHLTPSASASCPKARAWKNTHTKFGIGLSTSGEPNLGADLTDEQHRFGTKIHVVRVWDNGVPSASIVKQRRSYFGMRWQVDSIKVPPAQINSGAYDTRLRQYFRAMPKRAPIFYSYFHEPEDEVKAGQFTTAAYRQAFRHIVGIASSLCRTNLYPTLILMSWTADPASGLHWRDFYPGRRYVSVLGWDPYNGANGFASSYAAPRTIFGPVFRASRSAGKPTGIAETGSVRINGDASGTGRAAWLKKVTRYTRRHHAAFVTYFQATRKGNFELTDAPSVAAWRSAMRQ